MQIKLRESSVKIFNVDAKFIFNDLIRNFDLKNFVHQIWILTQFQFQMGNSNAWCTLHRHLTRNKNLHFWFWKFEASFRIDIPHPNFSTKNITVSRSCRFILHLVGATKPTWSRASIECWAAHHCTFSTNLSFYFRAQTYFHVWARFWHTTCYISAISNRF